MALRPLTIAALAAAMLPTLLGATASGQTMVLPGSQAPPSLRQQSQDYSLLHVNAVSGSDTSGDGSQLRPFQTISHALDVAPADTIILLAPGEYSAESGEVFPLRLQPGVTVQGAVGLALGGTIIRGNGTFVAANGTYMQATLVASDRAGLSNVTVTNPSSSGHGLVVAAGRPVIRANAFVGSGYAGAYVGGTAAPLFEQNLFSENGSVGLFLADQSRAEVVANTFENTGTGIQIAPGAQPRITQNRIVSNRQGVVMAADAQPHLQGNEIARNRQNGLIEFAAAGKTDGAETLAASAPQPLVSRPGLTSEPLATTEVTGASSSAADDIAPSSEESRPGVESGSMEDSQDATSAAAPPSSDPVEDPLLDPPGVASTEEITDNRSALNNPTSIAELRAAESSQPRSLDLTLSVPLATVLASSEEDVAQPVRTNLQREDEPEGTTEMSSVPLQVTPPSVNAVTQPEDVRPIGDGPYEPQVSAIDEAELERVMNLPILPDVDPNAEVLQVPAVNIPAGQGTLQVPVLTAAAAGDSDDASLTTEEPPPPPSRAAMLGLVYRVVVAASDSSRQAEVRALVPDAFRVEVDDQMMMQVGAYPTEVEAIAILETLQQAGLEGQVLYVP